MLLFAVVLVTTLLTCGAQEYYYVTPTPRPNPNCPAEVICETLSYYAVNGSQLLSYKSSVYLIFLEGDHSTTDSLYVQNTNIMAVLGNGNKESVKVLIPFLRLMTDVLLVRDISFINSSTYFYNSPTFNGYKYVYSMLLQKILFQNSYVLANSSAIIPNVAMILVDVQAIADGRKFEIIANNLALDISNCMFQQAVNLLLYPDQQLETVKIQNSVFKGTVEYPALQLQAYPHYSINSLLTLQDVSFIGNGYTALTIYRPVEVVIHNCQFINNSGIIGGAIDAANSRLIFSGDNLFLNNAGANGGAIHLLNSTIWLEKKSNTTFEGNAADKIGGAVFSEPGCGQGSCFYSLVFNISESDPSIPVSIVFDNNTALDGSDIYGAGLQNYCEVTPNRNTKSCDIQDSIFTFKNPSLTSVTTSPERVCLCKNDTPNCAEIDHIFYDLSVAAGEKFTLSVALVGENFGTTAGGVYASSVSTEPNFTFESSRKLQLFETTEKCTPIQYSIEPHHDAVTEVSFLLSTDRIAASKHQQKFNNPDQNIRNELILSVDTYKRTQCIDETLLTAPVLINITIVPCPTGLNMSDKHICECELPLNDYVTNCSAENKTGSFRRDKGVWIGQTDSDNSSETILVHRFCPFDYCDYNAVDVQLSNSDGQCALNHSGVLCGGCSEGLSLALGSSQCMDCQDNSFIAWIVLFIVGGIVLVMFIKVLDLTVSHGTVNGLIFYANVVWLNQGIFFSNINGHNNEILGKFFYVMKGFIACLNLDFGIETCFFKGFDAYWKTWLQFVYTFYLWFLAGLIVLVCRYSVRATKLFGSNPVSVLCTVILLSYVKLLRTVVDCLSPAILDQFNPTDTKWVWLLDGHVSYLGLKHAFLFAASISVLLLLWLPYTFALLFVRHLHKLPCGLSRYTVRLIPFLDSYTGPLKVKHQYWVGLSLLTRVGLAIIVIVSQVVDPVLNIAILCIVASIFCAIVIPVYKKLYNTFLEVVFLLNVVSLCIVFFAYDDAETRAIGICVSSFVCLLLLIGILSFHTYHMMKKCLSFCKWNNGYHNLDTISLDGDSENEKRVRVSSKSSTIVLREELLSSTKI